VKMFSPLSRAYCVQLVNDLGESTGCLLIKLETVGGTDLRGHNLFFIYFYINDSITGTPNAFAILVSVSIVGFLFAPLSILITIFNDTSAKRATFSREIFFLLRSFFAFSEILFFIMLFSPLTTSLRHLPAHFSL